VSYASCQSVLGLWCLSTSGAVGKASARCPPILLLVCHVMRCILFLAAVCAEGEAACNVSGSQVESTCSSSPLELGKLRCEFKSTCKQKGYSCSNQRFTIAVSGTMPQQECKRKNPILTHCLDRRSWCWNSVADGWVPCVYVCALPLQKTGSTLQKTEESKLIFACKRILHL
jgi:hypothetical protein